MSKRSLRGEPDIIIALGGEGYFAFPKKELDAIRDAFGDESVEEIDLSSLPRFIQSARALLTWQFPKELLLEAKSLQFVMYAADGLGPKRMYPELVSSSVAVINSRGVRAQAMAEHAIGALLGLSRRLFFARDAQLKNRWAKKELIEAPLPMELSGKKLVVLGLGEIGLRVAQIAKLGLQMHVVGVRANVNQQAPSVDQLFAPRQLKEAMKGAHAVVVALPPTPATEKLVGAEALSALAPGAFFLNMGRGASLDEAALIEALLSGQVGGAALDVFLEEPLPATSPLWAMPQVLITPHSSGVTPGLWPKINEIFIDNLRRAKDGQPLRNLVDKIRGY